jgi:hypothetical protein
MAQLESLEGRTLGLFRFAGYGLLVLGLFDYINIFIPMQWLNPVWELQTMGNLVERVPIPFLGMVLVFYGEGAFREKLEKPILKWLSWAALVVGILFLLLIPLGIRDTARIHSSNETLLKSQMTQQMSQVQQIQDRLKQATSEQDITNVLTILNKGNLPKLQAPQEVKNQVLSKLNVYEKNIQQQSSTILANQLRDLLKISVKWNLGALVSGALFIYLWRVTAWARFRRRF